MRPFTILFTSAGRRVSLVRLFRSALEGLEIPHQLITADLRADAPAHAAGDEREIVPRIDNPRYVDRLIEICCKHDARLLVPLIDTELHLLASHRDAFGAVGTTLLLSSPETTDIAHDKRRTAEFFRGHGIPAPRTFGQEELSQIRAISYPVLLKPAAGSGGAGVTKIQSQRELEFFLDYIPNAIVQEYIEGDEFTLDVLVDFSGHVRCVVPRLRIETRAGEVSKAMTVRDAQLIDAGRWVAEAVPGARGCITLQCFRQHDGTLRFIEINPRFGGGFPLSAAAGADFPRWIIEWMLGHEPEIRIDGWQDGLVMLRYDEAVFVDRATLT